MLILKMKCEASAQTAAVGAIRGLQHIRKKQASSNI